MKPRFTIRNSTPIDREPEIKNQKSELPLDWLLWQLSDSAFPTGGFAHSAGLEAAWQHGEVRNRADVSSFIEANLNQLGHASLPFVTAAHAEPERLRELDELCEAFTTNHVANRASRLQGKALTAAAGRIFQSKINSDRSRAGNQKSKMAPPPFGHLAPIFGALTRHLDLTSTTAPRLFFFNHLRGLLAAAVRLNIIGPMEAQALQFEFGPRAEAMLLKCESLSLDDLAQTAPLLEIWQGGQDRLYSRLFQS